MKVKLGETWKDGVTAPYYGHGPLWLIVWWHVCGWFYGKYWNAHRRLEGWGCEDNA